MYLQSKHTSCHPITNIKALLQFLVSPNFWAWYVLVKMELKIADIHTYIVYTPKTLYAAGQHEERLQLKVKLVILYISISINFHNSANGNSRN